MSKYFVRIQGRVSGPIDLNRLLDMKAKGQLHKFHEISVDRFKWYPAAEFADLYPAASLPPPQPEAEAEPAEDVERPYAPRARRRRSKGPVVVVVVAAILLVGGAVAGVLYYQKHGPADSTPSLITGNEEEKLANAVGLVACGVEVVGPRGDKSVLLGGTGSCFTVSPKGHLLTNKHVIEEVANLRRSLQFQRLLDRNAMRGEPRVWVFLNKKRYEAQILHIDDDFDFGILKVDAETPSYFSLRSEGKLPRQTKVAAYGFPGGVRGRLTVDELGNDINPLDLTGRGQRTVDHYFKPRDLEYSSSVGTVSRLLNEEVGRTRVDRRVWVEHTATINPGNSGGPLVDDDGVVVGINTLMADKGTNIYWSLSMAQLKSEIDKYVTRVVWK